MLSGIDEKDMKFNVFLGFDGFIDKILKPIKTKTGSEVIPFSTMKEFSSYISEKNGSSCSIDLETIQVKIGGNMPIAANALGNLGCQVVCLGAMGYPEINPIFQNMSENCKLVSVSNPGYCDSLEFENGKLMLACNNEVDALDYQQIISVIGEDALVNYITQSDAVSFLNWGELIHSNDIWENILKYIIPRCTFKKKKIMLIDFSDFSKRKDKEVEKMLQLINRYSEHFNITISLNKNELDLLAEQLDFDKGNNHIEEKMIAVSSQINCTNLVVHLIDSSYYIQDEEVFNIEKEVIDDPKVITGGGDNFNAGLLYGLLLGLDIRQAIKVGSSLACLYVESGKNISLTKLKEYIFENNYRQGR